MNRNKPKSIIIFISLFIITAMGFLIQERCQGYIMPAEQLIRFIAGRFSKIGTLVITRSIATDGQGDAKFNQSFKEKIWLKSPYFFRSKVIDQGIDRAGMPDTTYMQLLIANREERLTWILSGMGINLKSVGYTRIEGVICYRIGDKSPGRPKILIEKERFFPLLLIYISPSDPGKMVSVRFKDYRNLNEGWYPYEIIYSDSSMLSEKYTVETLDLNVPIDSSLFSNLGVKLRQPHLIHGKEQSMEEKERLRRIIKTFEEKYR